MIISKNCLGLLKTEYVVKAVYKSGVLGLSKPLPLREGEEVIVIVRLEEKSRRYVVDAFWEGNEAW